MVRANIGLNGKVTSRTGPVPVDFYQRVGNMMADEGQRRIAQDDPGGQRFGDSFGTRRGIAGIFKNAAIGKARREIRQPAAVATIGIARKEVADRVTVVGQVSH